MASTLLTRGATADQIQAARRLVVTLGAHDRSTPGRSSRGRRRERRHKAARRALEAAHRDAVGLADDLRAKLAAAEAALAAQAAEGVTTLPVTLPVNGVAHPPSTPAVASPSASEISARLS